MPTKRHRNRHGISAWLVTWESTSPLDRNKIVAVFRPQLAAEKIRQIVEALYSSSVYTDREKIRWALKSKENPYPAEFDRINGVPWQGRIHCGHNPYLFARLVDELRVESREDGSEETVWDERRARTPGTP